MISLPARYAWLGRVTAPRHLVEAVCLYGIHEAVGSANNQTILDWAKEVDVDDVYHADSTPWCGLFAAVVMKRGGWDPVKNPLWALNWSRFGQASDRTSLGDILTFKRPGGGHVGFYVGEDDVAYHVLGGNQRDQVCVTRIVKSRLYAARRPKWRVAQPDSVRPVRLASSGSLSTNEA